MSPKTIDAVLRGLIEYLELEEAAAVHVKFRRPIGFEPDYANCHLNVWCQTRRQGGQPQHGWVLAQDKAQSFSEALFHTVWRSPDGQLVDVTPRKDGEKRLLFVPDEKRSITLATYGGRPAIRTYDNVRVLGATVVSPLQEITVVLEGAFAHEQGLWPW